MQAVNPFFLLSQKAASYVYVFWVHLTNLTSSRNDVKRIFITKELSKLEGQTEGNRSGSVQSTDFLVEKEKKKKRVTFKLQPERIDFDVEEDQHLLD